MADEFRVGKVSAVDYAAGTVRVVYPDRDNSVTRPLPLLSGEYNMPQVGSLVLVLHLSNGTEAGVVLGSPWSDKRRPPEGGAGLYRKDLDAMPGKAMIRYQNGVLTIQAPSIVIAGDLTVTGTVTAKGVETAGDVTADGVSLKSHTHSGANEPPE